MKQNLMYCVLALFVGLIVGFISDGVGSLADWAMVLVTALTLYCLYQQFAEMKKQTASLQISGYEKEMQDCLLRIARILHHNLKPESYAYVVGADWGGDDKLMKLLEEYLEEYEYSIKNSDRMSLVDAIKRTLPRIEIYLLNEAEREDVSRYCEHIKELYHRMKAQSVLYNQYNVFAENFLKKEQEYKAKMAMPLRNDEMKE